MPTFFSLESIAAWVEESGWGGFEPSEGVPVFGTAASMSLRTSEMSRSIKFVLGCASHSISFYGIPRALRIPKTFKFRYKKALTWPMRHRAWGGVVRPNIF